jgi:polysaccharide pyruvyl transferase CsaB
MRCTVAAWIGSTNLGDELIFAALRAKLASRGVVVSALSVDPAATSASHGVPGLRRRSALARRQGDLMVLGGGGLLQDETSSLNLPFHLSPVALARTRRTPIAGVALGAGRLTTRAGRALVRRMLGGVELSVRDRPSADLLESIGLPRPVLAADLALSLPRPSVEPVDRIVACLRPWSGGRHRLPVALRASTTPDWFLAGAASALDELADRAGLPVHLVALDAERDDPVHQAVAARMRSGVTTARPGLDEVVGEVAASRLVVATRYHGAIAAALGGRPVALIGYSPKVEALAGDLGTAATLLRWDRAELAELAGRAVPLLGRHDDMEQALGSLRERGSGNDAVLDRLLERARVRSDG